VLPQIAALTIHYGAAAWLSDGWASDQIDLVAAEHGIGVVYVATSEAHRETYAPVADGLARGQVALSACAGVDVAVAQLRRVCGVPELGPTGARTRIVVPEDVGGDHGDLGVALVRALAAAGCGREDDGIGGVSAVPGRYAGHDPRARGGYAISP
jgi:hypothetical protein